MALLAAGSGATLDLAAVALIVLGLPAAVLGNDRLGRVAAAGRGGPYAATDAGFGWGWGGAGWSGSDCGDGGGGFFGGGDFGGGGGGGDGGGGC